MSEAIFAFEGVNPLGTVKSVDTATVVVAVSSLDQLLQLQVNRLVALRSSKAQHTLIGMVQKISRSLAAGTTFSDSDDVGFELDETESLQAKEINLVKIALIGTFIDKVGIKSNVFRRTLETVPDIEAECYAIEKHTLTAFMRAVSESDSNQINKLNIGTYTLDDEAQAFLSGNKLFQRHAVIVGSTGSGKSWTVARLLEQVADLPSANAVLVDTHGEYSPLNSKGFRRLKIAGPGDVDDGRSLAEGVLYLPFWLMGYEESVSMLVDRSDQNAPNQTSFLARLLIDAKKEKLSELDKSLVLNNFTSDSPIPFSINGVISKLRTEDEKMVEGSRGPKQGDLHGKLSRLIMRLESKITDRRLSFMFGGPPEVYSYNYLNDLAKTLLLSTNNMADKTGGVKVIDFSEVPSDILPLVISTLARLIFQLQFWTKRENRHPIALFCDEAHLYIPENESSSLTGTATKTFERISKEGRKYGVSLVVISQRPAEVNRTVLSQCGNFIAMRLTNAEDQNVIKKLMPDSLSGFSDLLPILDVGEALIVGDASLLPSRVRIAAPVHKPESLTIPFWDCWSSKAAVNAVDMAVDALRMQSQK